MQNFFPRPHRNEEPRPPFDEAAVLETLESPAWPGSGYLVTCCLDPELLPQRLRDEIYALSKTRPGMEDVEYDPVQPSIGPGRFDGAFNVGLIFCRNENNADTQQNPEHKGMVFNPDAWQKNDRNPNAVHLQLTCGPSFIYEYAAWITTKLAERFPELAIDGGLDCEGGFSSGCTYCTDLYAFERFTFKTGRVSDLLTRLFQEKIVKPVLLKRIKSHRYKYLYDETCFSMVKGVQRTGVYGRFDVAAYEQQIETIWAREKPPLETKLLCSAFVAIDWENKTAPEWSDLAYITAWREAGQTQVELLVPRLYRQQTEQKLRDAGIEFS